MSESVVGLIVIILLIGIGMISFSTVGFSLRAYQNKAVWAGFSKYLLITGVVVTLSCIILLMI